MEEQGVECAVKSSVQEQTYFITHAYSQTHTFLLMYTEQCKLIVIWYMYALVLSQIRISCVKINQLLIFIPHLTYILPIVLMLLKLKYSYYFTITAQTSKPLSKDGTSCPKTKGITTAKFNQILKVITR